MNCNLSRAVATSSLLLFSPLLIWAADVTATTTTTTTTTTSPVTSSEAAHTAAVKRHELAVSARQSVIDGEKLLSIYNYDAAADRFQYATDALSPGGESVALYSRAESDLALAKEGQAHQLATQSKFAQAASLVEQAIALEPNDPRYQQDLEDLKEQQVVYEKQVRNPEGTVNNPAVTQDFKDKVSTVQKLLFQGDAYFKTGQYERAEDTFSKILILDPYNKAARDAMNHMEKYRIRAADLRREEYKDEAMLKVDQGWEQAISPDVVVPPSTQQQVSEPSNRAQITNKLQTIIIDKINFDKLDVASVVQFLTEKSKELDKDHVGINFVLNLNQDVAPSSATPSAATPSGPTGTGTPGGAGATGSPGTGGAAQPSGTNSTPPPGPIHRAVTIQLENVPLSDVLGYIIQQTNLQYSVDDYAVYLRPSIDEGQTLSVRTYLAPPNFFTSSGGLRVSASSSPDQPSNVTDVSNNVEQELSDRGIHFPPGATAVFLPGSSKLVVRNTPEQLDLIGNLIEQLSKETPQVQIEAKLAEFTDTALKSLSFNYIAGSQGLLSKTSVFNSAGHNGGFTTTTGLRDAHYSGASVNTSSGGAPDGGLQPDSIDSLVQSNTSSNTGLGTPAYPLTGLPVLPNTPNFLTLGAIVDGIGFAAIVNALNNDTGVDLISAPTVTTQNGLKANIDIVREFPYPTSFEKPKLGNTEVAYSSGEFGPRTDVVAGVVISTTYPLQLAIPPTPREFVTQDIGVSLEVKPTTYPDQRIDLDVTKAQVIDFDGFIDYGVPIVTKLAEEYNPVVLTPGTINQPVFNTRSIVTRLQILDGQTAVLGGLLREDTQEIHDKVPVLGDLPLIGRLFQSKVSSRIKKNLIIFITAKLIKSNGKPEYIHTLEAEPEVEEKLPEPEPLNPGVSLPPLSPEEPNS
jgi:general secretion pathway protein D